MQQPREGLSFWRVTGETPDVRSQGDQSLPLERTTQWTETTLADRDDVHYSIRGGAAGSGFSGAHLEQRRAEGRPPAGGLVRRRNQQVSVKAELLAAPAPQKGLLTPRIPSPSSSSA